MPTVTDIQRHIADHFARTYCRGKLQRRHGSVTVSLLMPQRFVPARWTPNPWTSPRASVFGWFAVARSLGGARFAALPHTVQVAIACLPWSEQNSRPSLAWNVAGLMHFRQTHNWTLALQVRRTHCTIGAYLAYPSREAGERAFIALALHNSVRSSHPDPRLWAGRLWSLWKGGSMTSPLAAHYYEALYRLRSRL